MGSVSGNGQGGRKKNTPFDHGLDANQFRDPPVWRRYGCMSGCLVPFTIFAIVEATAVSSLVPNNRMIISHIQVDIRETFLDGVSLRILQLLDGLHT